MAEKNLKFLLTIQTNLIHVGISKSLLIRFWPYLAIIIAHTIWGINFVVTKVTLQEIPPMSLAFLRFTLAIILLSPFLITEKIKIDKADLPKLIGIGVLMVTLNIAFFYAGLSRTSVTSASVLTMIIPLVSVLFGWWLLKEKIYTTNLIGILLGLFGAILVIGLPFLILGLQGESESLLGSILIILASITWVVGAIISKEMLTKYSTLTITAIIFLVGIATFIIPAMSEYLKDPSWPSKVTLLGLMGLSFISFASSISAYFLFEWGLSKIGIIKADLFQYLEPLVAVSLGVFILNEQLRFSFIIGALLVGLGVYWSTLGKERHKHHKAHRT